MTQFKSKPYEIMMFLTNTMCPHPVLIELLPDNMCAKIFNKMEDVLCNVDSLPMVCVHVNNPTSEIHRQVRRRSLIQDPSKDGIELTIEVNDFYLLNRDILLLI